MGSNKHTSFDKKTYALCKLVCFKPMCAVCCVPCTVKEWNGLIAERVKWMQSVSGKIISVRGVFHQKKQSTCNGFKRPIVVFYPWLMRAKFISSRKLICCHGRHFAHSNSNDDGNGRFMGKLLWHSSWHFSCFGFKTFIPCFALRNYY